MPKLTQDVVEKYLELVSGTFDKRQIMDDLLIRTREGKDHLRVILHRLCEADIIVRTGKDGTYRKIKTEREEIDWSAADTENTMPLLLPFGINKYCKFYPQSIIIVAGGKNAGKTAFLMECAMLNQDLYEIDFFNCETSAEQFKERAIPLGLKPSRIHLFKEHDNFADVMLSDRLTIIDYLDMNSELYPAGVEIDRIFKKTRSAVIIGMQKPPPTYTFVRGVKTMIDRDLAYGGGFTAKRAVLYVSLGMGKCKLVHVKNPADKKMNPNNKQWTYNFDEFGFFKNIKDYQEPINEFI